MKICPKYLIPFLWIIAPSCSIPDNSAPVVEYFKVNGSTDSPSLCSAGSMNEFEIKTGDDKSLSQVKISVKSSSVYSSPEGDAALFTYPSIGAWDEWGIINISGNESDDKISFYAPDSLSGRCLIDVAVVDKNGNLTSKQYKAYVQNLLLPELNISGTTPAANEEGKLIIALNESLSIIGSAEDTDGLSDVSVTIKMGSSIIYEDTQMLGGTTSFGLDQLVFPAFTEAGNYSIEIYANDVFTGTLWARAAFLVQ